MAMLVEAIVWDACPLPLALLEERMRRGLPLAKASALRPSRDEIVSSALRRSRTATAVSRRRSAKAEIVEALERIDAPADPQG